MMFCLFSTQDLGRIAMAEREARSIYESTPAGRRQSRIRVPQHDSPISIEEENQLKIMFNPDLVTLDNLIEKYEFVKSFVTRRRNVID